MTTMTLTERIAEDNITMRVHNIGTREVVYPDVRGMTHEWLCVLYFPADDSSFYLGAEDEEDGISNYVGRYMTMVFGGSIADYYREEARPTVAEVIDSIRSDAMQVAEHEGDVARYIAECVMQAGEKGRSPEEIREEAATFRSMQRVAEDFRALVGDKFEQYLYETDSDV